jgi:hypothetical protein
MGRPPRESLGPRGPPCSAQKSAPGLFPHSPVMGSPTRRRSGAAGRPFQVRRRPLSAKGVGGSKSLRAAGAATAQLTTRGTRARGCANVALHWREFFLITKTCARARCGATYEAKRASSKYCSPRCRAYASRDRAPARMVGAPPPLVDPDSFDAKAILATIGSDPDQPGAVRVAACRAFLAASGQQSTTREENSLALLDKRTMEILNRQVH